MPDKLLQLAKRDLVEIGAHIVTHPVLAALPVAEQRIEIQQSKVDFTEILGHSMASFSCPYGLPSAYTAESVALVREAGFTCGGSADTDVAWPGSDRFQLFRLWIEDRDEETFAHRLARWLHD